ncbi:MAG: biopolymer transporter ExbD [Flavobacteriaceae bacterium]|nr:biopolymer transporter ExbD [Flavobacteriaceae bacterium]
MAKRGIPEVNAGSMADIAFLLLIFFLVTTTIETDSGIDRKLPAWDETPQDQEVIIKEKNMFAVQIGADNRLLVREEIMDIKNLRQAAIDFIDNGGGKADEACTYCQGKKDPLSSDNPDKAIISVKNSRKTKYGVFVAVQNELVAAYNFLRDRESMKKYKVSFTEMYGAYTDPRTDSGTKEKLKPKIEAIKELYPLKISEAETKNY